MQQEALLQATCGCKVASSPKRCTARGMCNLFVGDAILLMYRLCGHPAVSTSENCKQVSHWLRSFGSTTLDDSGCTFGYPIKLSWTHLTSVSLVPCDRVAAACSRSPWCLIKHDDVQTFGGLELRQHTSASVIHGGQLASRLGRFTSEGKKKRCPMDQSLGGLQNQTGSCGDKKNPALPGIEPRSSSPYWLCYPPLFVAQLN
jgi:hypothetical protein